MPSALFSERYAIVVEVLTTARCDAGLTQVELAQRLGRLQSYVSKIERRERRVDVTEFIDWARAVNANPTTLFEAVAERLAS